MNVVYTLPDQYGSIKVFELDFTDIDVPKGYAAVAPAGLRSGDPILLIAREHLTPVKPPLPEEPPVGSVVRQLTGYRAGIVSVFERDDYGWYGAGKNEPWSWATICADGPPVVLIPAPEPVALPWEGRSVFNAPIGVGLAGQSTTRGEGIRVVLPGGVEADGCTVSPDTALAMAAALQTAASR